MSTEEMVAVCFWIFCYRCLVGRQRKEGLIWNDDHATYITADLFPMIQFPEITDLTLC